MVASWSLARVELVRAVLDETGLGRRRVATAGELRLVQRRGRQPGRPRLADRSGGHRRHPNRRVRGDQQHRGAPDAGGAGPGVGRRRVRVARRAGRPHTQAGRRRRLSAPTLPIRPRSTSPGSSRRCGTGSTTTPSTATGSVGADTMAAVDAACAALTPAMTETEAAGAVSRRLPGHRAVHLGADGRRRGADPPPPPPDPGRRAPRSPGDDRGLRRAGRALRQPHPLRALRAARRRTGGQTRGLPRDPGPPARRHPPGPDPRRRVRRLPHASTPRPASPDGWRHHHQGGLTGYRSREAIATPGAALEIADGQAFAWNPSLPGAKAEETFVLTARRPRGALRLGLGPAAFEEHGGDPLRVVGHRDVPEAGQGHEPGRGMGPPGPAGLVREQERSRRPQAIVTGTPRRPAPGAETETTGRALPARRRWQDGAPGRGPAGHASGRPRRGGTGGRRRGRRATPGPKRLPTIRSATPVRQPGARGSRRCGRPPRHQYLLRSCSRIRPGTARWHCGPSPGRPAPER